MDFYRPRSGAFVGYVVRTAYLRACIRGRGGLSIERSTWSVEKKFAYSFLVAPHSFSIRTSCNEWGEKRSNQPDQKKNSGEI
jgi:hypothetical protein